jgi:hypothetical protein
MLINKGDDVKKKRMEGKQNPPCALRSQIPVFFLVFVVVLLSGVIVVVVHVVCKQICDDVSLHQGRDQNKESIATPR